MHYKYNKEKKKVLEWRMMYENKRTDIKLFRLSTIKEHYESLIKIDELPNGIGYFKYKPYKFISHLMNINVDLIFVNNDDQVIKLYPNFSPNKFTETIPEAKFVYILRSTTIKQEGIEIGDIIRHQKWKRKG